MKKVFVLSSWSRIAAIGSIFALALLSACGDDSSSVIPDSTSSSVSVIPGSDPESSGVEKITSSSSSAYKETSSSSSIALATPCKTESEDNCEYGELIDDRDGQTYKTVKIGVQWWMVQNLNYETENSWCGGGAGGWTTEGDCSVYGRLYTWAAAMGKSEDECGYGYDCTTLGTGSVQGVCPDGWHVPTQSEWIYLFASVGDESTAGQKLKAQTSWDDYPGITNQDAYGFSALPAGFRGRNGGFGGVGDGAYFWSATQYYSSYSFSMYLICNYDYAYLKYDFKNYGFSVRCLKD